MEPIAIKLPPGADVSNYLYPDMELCDLTQDMLTVRLPNGYFIDVGWYPEHDLTGRFLIRVFHEYWDRQKADPVEARTVEEVVFLVETIAQRYSQQIVARSQSASVRGSKILV